MCRQAPVQWQLAWARCPNSSPPLWRSSWQPPLMEKHDSNPSIQTPECHSEINRQIIHQWDIVPPLLPPLQQRWSGFFSATEGLWSNINPTIIFTALLKYGRFLLDLNDEKNSFRCSACHECVWQSLNTLLEIFALVRRTCQLHTCQSKNTLRIILC